MNSDELTVAQFLDAGVGDIDLNEKLIPLVSRRKHREFWFKLGKNLQDGNLFIFADTPLQIGLTCGCTDEQLQTELNEVINSVVSVMKEDDPLSPIQIAQTPNRINILRQEHNLDLEYALATNQCTHPKEVYAHQNKHTIGNWGCKACMSVGQDLELASDAKEAMARVDKNIEWCPRFFPILRHLPIAEYMKTVKDNKICYGGLLHSELTFEDEHEVTNIPVCDGLMESVKIKHYAVITKKCDTCSYIDVQKKEYTQPEEVKSDDVLQVL
jgi:hypothetical protein